MSDIVALHVGGPLDGKVQPLKPPHDEEYTRECVYLEGEPTILFNVHISLTTKAALHTVFAAYYKEKGKK